MAKLLPITETVYRMVENAICYHCDKYIDETEVINTPDHIFWCIDCVRIDRAILEPVLKEIDSKLNHFPTTYEYANKGEKRYRYYWWASNQYVSVIRKLPKLGAPRKIEPDKIVVLT